MAPTNRFVMTIPDDAGLPESADEGSNENAVVSNKPEAAGKKKKKHKRSKKGDAAAPVKAKKAPELNPDFEFEEATGAFSFQEWNPTSQLVVDPFGAHSTTTTEKIERVVGKRKATDERDDGEQEEDDKEEDINEDDMSEDDSDDDNDDDDDDDDDEEEEDEEEAKPQPKLAFSDDDDEDLDEDQLANIQRKAKFFAPEPERDEQADGTSFSSLNLSRPLLKAVSAMGYVEPTAIQTRTIPVALLGRDICACSSTGSGKTAAFMLPVLERLLFRPKQYAQMRVLILSPTRELAVQVADMGRKLASFTDITFGLAVGGMSVKAQELELQARPDIVVATPGRLVDHIQNTHSFDITTIEVLILDEADRLLEVGFAGEVDMIIRSCPKQRTTMLFSATMTDEVEDLIKLSLNEPVRLFINKNTKVTDNVTQEFIRIRPHRENTREAIVLALCKRTYKYKVVLFVRSKKHAHRLRVVFGLCGLSVDELHGSLNQAQRLEALERFKDGKVEFLICTDLASRGLDIPNVNTVINLNMPHTLKAYIHRVGRCGRAGQAGRSVSLVGQDERKLLRDIVKAGGKGMKSRVIPSATVDKYLKGIESLKEEISAVMKAEKEEAELRQAQIEVRRARNIIEHQKEIMSKPKKTWIQSTREKAAAKELSKKGHKGVNALPSDNKDPKRESNLAMKKKRKREEAVEGMDKKAQMAVSYAVRQAKRLRKPKRITVVKEDTAKAKKTKKVSKAFTSELTDTSKKAVAALRNQKGPAATAPKKAAKKSESLDNPFAASGEKKGKFKNNKKFKSKKRYKRR